MKRCLVSSLLLGLFLIGCGGSDSKPLKLAPVAGVVNYKGAGVADATIVFYPEKGPVATAKTDSKGAFQVRTNGQLGTSAGKNKVTVVAAQQDGPIPQADGNEMKLLEKQNAIPKKYNAADTTDLIVDVPAEGNKSLTLDLTD
jgi:hypothetical protein